MNRVYVLVNVKRGTVKDVLKEISRLKGVSEVSIVSGRYDMFAKIEGKPACNYRHNNKQDS